MQHKLEPGRLLYDDGNLAEAGYATSLVKEYNRSWIKAHSLRIKEWDYYYIGNENHGIALTIADNSYMSMVSISFLNFVSKTETTKSIIKFFPKRKLNLPSTSETGDIEYNSKKCNISFKHVDGKRRIQANFKNFDNKIDLRCDLYLTETNEDSIVIATPFKKNKHFYYNQKINLLSSSGYVKIGETIYDFNKDTFGVLDWGRGVWTYKNTWYWSSLNAVDHGKRIGFNLGYGFGDTSAASENMLFIDDKSYKLDQVHFDIPINKFGKDDYMKPWKFRSQDGTIDLTFTPVLNRHASSNAIVIKSIQNQVFGHFNGTIMVDDRVVAINDLMGFAEKVTNYW
jgi:hypothetical protein